MKKLFILSLTLTLLLQPDGRGQVSGKLSAGIGAGLDYGGFGTQFSYSPLNKLDLFGAFGYNLNSLGYNFGAKFTIPSRGPIDWHITGMYGYNAVLIAKAETTSKVTYYGPSIGAGLIFKWRNLERSFFSFEIILPFRPVELSNAMHDLKLVGYEVKDPWPVTFSLGYHFKLL
jgi:hypothetical protein